MCCVVLMIILIAMLGVYQLTLLNLNETRNLMVQNDMIMKNPEAVLVQGTLVDFRRVKFTKNGQERELFVLDVDRGTSIVEVAANPRFLEKGVFVRQLKDMDSIEDVLESLMGKSVRFNTFHQIAGETEYEDDGKILKHSRTSFALQKSYAVTVEQDVVLKEASVVGYDEAIQMFKDRKLTREEQLALVEDDE